MNLGWKNIISMDGFINDLRERKSQAPCATTKIDDDWRCLAINYCFKVVIEKILSSVGEKSEARKL